MTILDSGYFFGGHPVYLFPVTTTEKTWKTAGASLCKLDINLTFCCQINIQNWRIIHRWCLKYGLIRDKNKSQKQHKLVALLKN